MKDKIITWVLYGVMILFGAFMFWGAFIAPFTGDYNRSYNQERACEEDVCSCPGVWC